jgi:hypothetical protein
MTFDPDRTAAKLGEEARRTATIDLIAKNERLFRVNK